MLGSWREDSNGTRTNQEHDLLIDAKSSAAIQEILQTAGLI
jgi:hypothetical protein